MAGPKPKQRHCAGCLGRAVDGCPGANGGTSDGYHTFDELYDHRVTLFVALCAELALRIAPEQIWRSRLHSDGTSFAGWFVAGIWTAPGSQITYHLPDDRWPSLDFADTRERAPEFDGHTSADVLARIREITGQAVLEVGLRRRPLSPTKRSGFLYSRPMMQCKACRRWWSGEPVNGATQHCPCGGELEVADLAAHAATLPYHPFDPNKK